MEVETTAGRKEYVRRQAAVHDTAAPVRDRLLAAYDDFFLAHALVPGACEEAKLVVSYDRLFVNCFLVGTGGGC